jgi:hypothetical protein
MSPAQGVQPADGLLGCSLASAFALVFGVKGMQAAGERRNTAEAEQDLVEQVRAALGERNAEQDRPTIFGRVQGSKAGALGQFFGLVDEAAEGGFEGHGAIKPHLCLRTRAGRREIGAPLIFYTRYAIIVLRFTVR